MNDEVVLDDHTVIVRNGRIVQVGPASQLPVPKGVHTVNGRGKFLVPGLADMHVHILGRDALPLFVANGVTTVRNMFGSLLHLRLRNQFAHGTLLGPRIVTAGPIIDGDPPVWPGSAVVMTAEAGVQVARKQAAAGYDFLKVYERRPLDAYDAIINTADELGIPVAGHVPAAVGLKHAISRGQKSIEHLTGYGSELETSEAPPWEGPEHYRSMIHGWLHPKKDAMQALTRMTATSEVWNCPTQVVMERAFAVGDVDVFRYNGAEYIGPSLAAMWKRRPPPASITYLVEDTIPIRSRMIGELHRAGLAALLYAVDDAHALPASWLANRNALVAGVFGVLTLIAHDEWRRGRRKWGAFVAPALFLMALLCAESAVIVATYLLAYALFIDRDSLVRRFVALVPAVLVGLMASVLQANGIRSGVLRSIY